MRISPNSKLAAARLSSVNIIDREGEVIASLPISVGVHPAREILALVPSGGHLVLGDGVSLVQPRGGYGVQAYGPGSHDSGANPDFVPTSASRFEKQMRLMVAQVQASAQRIEARERQLAKIDRIPVNPEKGKPADVEVVDDAGEPDPAAEPTPKAKGGAE